MTHAIRVVLVGSFAREFLASHGTAKLIGVFRRSVYMENKSGLVVCVGGTGIGPGPLNVLCEFPGGIDLGKQLDLASDVRISRHCVEAGPIRLDASAFEQWRPEPLPADRDLGLLGRNLALLAERAARKGPREGLAPLIPHIVSGAEIVGGEAFQRVSWRGIQDFRNWLSHTLDKEGCQEFSFASPQLTGLGPGLTPSGDDFWCGVMIALYSLGCFEVLGQVASAILREADERTNRISRAHLECASKGQGAQALHQMIGATLAGNEADLDSALRTLNKIGHTSGWDSLAGVVCVLVVMASAKNTVLRPRFQGV